MTDKNLACCISKRGLSPFLTCFIFIVCFASLFGSWAFADNVTARRYGEIQDDSMFRLFSLLDREEVQADLVLSSNQLARIKGLWIVPVDSIAELDDLKTDYKTKRSNPKATDAEKQKLKGWFEVEFSRLMASYQKKGLATVLSFNQVARLHELLIQMQGPRVLASDAALAARLGLSEEQNEKMREIIAYYETDLKTVRWRYGRQQISARREDESREDRANELECLFVVIQAIEKEQDSALLGVLNAEQRAVWRSVMGNFLPIQWPESSIADYPFETQGTDSEKEQIDLRR